MQIDLRISVSDLTVPFEKRTMLYELSNRLNIYLGDKHFGNDVMKIETGFIMALPQPGYENWYKEKRPRYIEYRKTASKLTGESIETTKTIKYEVKLLDEIMYQFTGSDNNTSRHIILNEFVRSLEKLANIIKKTDFELENFKSSLIDFSVNQVDGSLT